ncbi:MAG: hypothetical protein KC636_32470, partial [Myxococcales bacterium]|nr:hypothetical protein [Myxococcales bacterium]
LAVDPDEAILQVASPIFLDLLKQNHKVSDYRLLAVPLAGEDASARFNGCLLGAPPKVFSEPGPQPGAITLTIDDPEAGGPYAADRPALVLWGDGTASRETIAVGQGAASFTHDYKLPGSYAVYAVVENTSGLRGVTSALVEVSQGAAEASAPHVFTEVRFVDAIAHVTVTSGNERKLSFEVSGRDVDTGEELLLGVGQERSVPFNVDAPLGTLVGHNPGARTIDRITLRPAWRDGFYGIGWGGHSLTLARLELRVPSTSSTDPVYVPVPLTTDNVRVYPVDGDAPVDVEYLTTTDDDRTLIWLHTSFVADRIEIDIPAGLLAESAPGPLADGAAPVFESHVEIRPGTFEPANTPSGETDGDSDGGSDGSDSTAGTGDTGDGATSDATAGTDSASGSGQDGDDGCGCAAGSGGALGLVLLPLLGFARRRRRTP